MDIISCQDGQFIKCRKESKYFYYLFLIKNIKKYILEKYFCTGFFLNIFFHKISTPMDSFIGLLLKVGTSAYLSGRMSNKGPWKLEPELEISDSGQVRFNRYQLQ